MRRVAITCCGCGVSISRFPWARYCSKACKRESKRKQKKNLRITKNILRARSIARYRVFEKKLKYGDSFYTSLEWLKLRAWTLKMAPRRGGLKCKACKSKKDLQVDHIKPRARFPELSLESSNLQILCKTCNLEKKDRDNEEFMESKGHKAEREPGQEG